MRRFSLPLALLALMIWIGSSQAGSSLSLERIARIARAAVIVPSEWDGIWTTQDSIYDCQQNPQIVYPGSDTLCGGNDYSPGGLTCTGTATATTVDLTCDGTQDAGQDCIATVHQVIHGTRNGSTYFLVSTSDFTYSGTGCTSTDPQCFQVNTHGTRASPTVPADCGTTPVKRSTWGQVKSIYR